jgi:hypothetical protein
MNIPISGRAIQTPTTKAPVTSPVSPIPEAGFRAIVYPKNTAIHATRRNPSTLNSFWSRNSFFENPDVLFKMLLTVRIYPGIDGPQAQNTVFRNIPMIAIAVAMITIRSCREAFLFIKIKIRLFPGRKKPY